MQRTHGALILARYSTDNQDEDTIEVQVDRCSKWCQAKGLPVLGVYADLAVSGMHDTRPQYARMMEDLRAGIGDTVVIYDQSRMFRRLTAWFSFREEAARLGAAIASVTQPNVGGDLRDPTNFVTEGSMALINQFWVLQTRQKVIDALRYKARTGQHTGGKPPLGYRVVDKRLEIDPAEAEIVRRIFGEYAAGRSYREIIEGLNRDGVRTKRGGAFGGNSLHDLLHNDKYIGRVTYGAHPYDERGQRNTHGAVAPSAIIIEDAIPAIIEREQYEEVQRRMASNKRQQGGRPVACRDYPLKGKVYCAECKGALVVRRSKGNYYYYACARRKRAHDDGCKVKPIRVDELERRVAEAVRATIGTPDNMEGLCRILREQTGEVCSAATRRVTALEAEAREVSAKLDRAINALLDGLSSPSLRAQIEALEQRKAELAAEITRAEGQARRADLPEAKLREIVETIANGGGGDEAVLSIVARVEVAQEYITIWTILDSGPDGKIHYEDEDAGVIISPGAPSGVPIVIITPGGALCIRARR